MIPLDGLSLEQEGNYDRENGDGNHFLNHFELHEIEGTAVFDEADSVGRNQQALFKKSDAPGKEDNENKRPVRRNFHLLKLQVPIPCKRHEDVGKHQHQNSPKPFHKYVYCFKRAKLVYLFDLKNNL